MEDLISIIVPVYNVESYLKECVASILNQTYKNIEIILVDDGSTDDSGKICDELKEKDNRIIVIHKKNGGLSDARNVGIDIANGRYITLIDSDDDIEKNYVEYLYKLIKQNNVKMSIAAYTVVSKDKKINIGQGYHEEVLTTEKALDRMLCEKGFSISSCAKLYARELFENIKFPIGKLNEDNGTTHKLIMKCDKLVYGNKSIYNYNKREDSITNSEFNLKKLDLIDLTDSMCNEIIQKYPNLKNSVEKKKITSRFSILRQMIGSRLDEEQRKIQKNLENYIKERKKEILKNPNMSTRDKIALITLLIGRSFFSFSWKVYCNIKY